MVASYFNQNVINYIIQLMMGRNGSGRSNFSFKDRIIAKYFCLLIPDMFPYIHLADMKLKKKKCGA